MILGKILGAFFGYLIGRSWGMIMGLFIGHIFDQSLRVNLYNPWFGYAGEEQQRIQQAFFRFTFQAMGHIAKSDGRVSEDEIKTARNIMANLGLSGGQVKQAIAFFTEGKQASFNLEAATAAFYQQCHKQRTLLQLFIDIQYQAALAEGKIGPNKQRILQSLAATLRVSANAEFYQHVYGRQQRQHHQRQRSSYQSKPSLADDYALLEINSSATMSEIKRAYKKQMSRNHPDKLIAKGLPEEMIKVATDKTQKIQAAYERIRKSRGE